jgi:hypothetical protein
MNDCNVIVIGAGEPDIVALPASLGPLDLG